MKTETPLASDLAPREGYETFFIFSFKKGTKRNGKRNIKKRRIFCKRRNTDFGSASKKRRMTATTYFLVVQSIPDYFRDVPNLEGLNMIFGRMGCSTSRLTL